MRVREDVRIEPHTVRRVALSGDFAKDTEWWLEKGLWGREVSQHPLAIPNTLFSSREAFVPVANTSDRPYYLRRGEILGAKVEALKALNRAETEGKWEAMSQWAALVLTLLAARKEAEENAQLAKD